MLPTQCAAAPRPSGSQPHPESALSRPSAPPPCLNAATSIRPRSRFRPSRPSRRTTCGSRRPSCARRCRTRSRRSQGRCQARGKAPHSLPGLTARATWLSHCPSVPTRSEVSARRLHQSTQRNAAPPRNLMPISAVAMLTAVHRMPRVAGVAPHHSSHQITRRTTRRSARHTRPAAGGTLSGRPPRCARPAWAGAAP